MWTKHFATIESAVDIQPEALAQSATRRQRAVFGKINPKVEDLICMDQLVTAFRSAKTQRACGHDRVPAEFFKCSSNITASLHFGQALKLSATCCEAVQSK